MKILTAMAISALLIAAEISAPAAAQSATTAQASAPASASATTLPDDFPIKWMRGLVLVDDPKGAKVVGGSDAELGKVFTLINDQPVTSVSDLVARVRASDPKTVKITTVKTEEVKTPRYVDWWAESLKYVDGPHGVLITSSNYPGEAGNYLSKLNDIEIKHASDVRPILLQVTADLSRFRSITISEPPAEDKAWAAATVAAQAQDPVSASVRQNWGPLANLPGKLWYCNAHDPLAWRLRHPTNRLASMPAPRMVAAEWISPYSAMKLTEREGSQTITDVISLQADGSFALSSTGVGGYANLTGRLAKDGQVYFQMGTYPGPGNMQLTDYLTFGMSGNLPKTSIHVYSGSSDLDDHSICTLEEYDELKLPRFARDLQYVRKQDGDWAQAEAIDDAYAAQLQAEGAQMAANMRASAFAEFAKIPQVAAQASQQRADLERLRVAAEEETARNAAAAKAASAAATNPQASPPSHAGSEVASASSATIAKTAAASAPTAQSTSARTGYFACNQMELGAKKEYWSSMFTAPWTFDTAVLDRYAAEFTQYLVSKGFASGRRGTCWMDSAPQSLLESREHAKHLSANAYITSFDIDWRPSSP
jgi:hypothetical protein